MAPPRKKTTKETAKNEKLVEETANNEKIVEEKVENLHDENTNVVESPEPTKKEETKETPKKEVKEEAKEETKEEDLGNWGADVDTEPVGEKFEPTTDYKSNFEEPANKRMKYDDSSRNQRYGDNDRGYSRDSGYQRRGYDNNRSYERRDSGYDNNRSYERRDSGYDRRDGGRGYEKSYGDRNSGYGNRERSYGDRRESNYEKRDFGGRNDEGYQSRSFGGRGYESNYQRGNSYGGDFNERRRPRTYEEVPPSEVIGLFNLRNSTEEEVIDFLGKKIPDIKYDNLKFITNRETGEPKGFAFVKFFSVEEATKAKDLLHEEFIRENKVRVDYSKQRARPDNSQY